MIFSENRYPLFGIMLWSARTAAPGSVAAIIRRDLHPGAVRILVIAAAVPPIVTASAPLCFAGNDGAGRGADRSSGNHATRAAAERAADDAAQRPADNRTANRILRRRLLRRQQCRHRQQHPSSQTAHHGRSPFPLPPSPGRAGLYLLRPPRVVTA